MNLNEVDVCYGVTTSLRSFAMSLIHPDSEKLTKYIVDIEEEVNDAHETMKDKVRISCEIHNKAISLVQGTGEFKQQYEDVQNYLNMDESNYNVDRIQLGMRDIIIEMKFHGIPSSSLDAELVRHRLGLIKKSVPVHPMVVHWEILRNRCYCGREEHYQDWPEFREENQEG